MSYQPGDMLLDLYRIEKFLGKGAFGEVYLCTRLDSNALHALKILQRDALGLTNNEYDELQMRFRLEAQLGERLTSPHLLRVYDNHIDEHVCLLEMQYASGGSLADQLQKVRAAGKFMPVEEALQIAAEVAEGLAVLHREDIIHRDLKPANILFDERRRAYVGDLGLVQVTSGPSKRSLLSKPVPQPGTAAYMSPEQGSSGGYLTPASDVYTLGVVLFEMLTGRNYNVQPVGTLVRQLRPDVPPNVESMLARMLASEPRKRPKDGADAAELLKGLRAEELKNKVQREEQQADQRRQEEIAKDNARQKQERRLQEIAARKALEGRGVNIELAPGVSMEFVCVPAGEFLMGADPRKDADAREREMPQHKRVLDEYWIGKFPVTNQQYQAFVVANRYKTPFNWVNGRYPQNKQDHPVVHVSWEDAVAFCAWAAKSCGLPLRLPSEPEWEKAARGADGRIHPWGDAEPDEQRCNFSMNIKDTSPVGKYSPLGDSPFFCADMLGNVWEWTADHFDRYAGNKENNPNYGTKYRVLRGGSWRDYKDKLRATRRGSGIPSDSFIMLGFRCALEKASAYERGLNHASASQDDHALADATGLDPARAESHAERGADYFSKGEYGRAIAEFNLAIQLDPSNAEYLSGRGASHYSNEDYERAIADFNEALELDPANADCYYFRGLSFLHQKDPARAIADFSQAIWLNPDKAVYFQTRGAMYHNKGEYGLAIEDYNRAIALDPDNAQYYRQRGKAYKAIGNQVHAHADNNRALKLSRLHGSHKTE